MAASAGRKQVKQEELRRLMREKKRQNADKKRIESPFAKYPRSRFLLGGIGWGGSVEGAFSRSTASFLNGVVTYNSLGHLSCALCSAPVKSELLWQTHVLGKQHRERVAELKGAKQAAGGPAASASPQPAKRKTADAESTQLKRTKGADDKPHTSTSTSELLSFLSDFFDSKTAAPPVVSHSGSIQKPETQEKIVERKENTAEALPEGFFDDPEVDAKVRKVDAPKDQMDKEWDEFQKAMRQVNTISEAIVAEDDEEGRLDRQIGEIDEQIECYRRVELLRNRQDLIKEKWKEAMRLKATQEKEDEDIGSEDEEELQDLLSQDWRVKGALL
ncbi:UNVERIFIED_CONTAM: hypothetical protein H355_003838 [Colinus virginianus]|nr:hypothetical protein H355_003838 [Colinus virginianus]